MARVDSRSSPAVLLGSLGCALALAVSGCGASSAASARATRDYTLMQANLCLSGLGACYARVAYPAVLDEAVARIRRAHPDAVTVNEACRDDVAEIARRTGLHLRFARVIYRGRPLPCIDPGGRGLFGDAVLTRAAIESSDSRAFAAHSGIERRRWLCARTRGGPDVCTAHLNTRDTVEAAGNDAQCPELARILRRRAAARAVIFGGDVNRRESCAPAGFWTLTDAPARQTAGFQQVYGSGALRSPSATVVPATHTDHDFLLAHARLSGGSRRSSPPPGPRTAR